MADLYRVNSGLVRKDGKLALGCNCCGPGCTDDGTLYGLLQPCSDQIDCDGLPVGLPCLVLEMASLPPITAGQKFLIYSTCYTLTESNKTRCQIDPIDCGGRGKLYAKVLPEDIEVVSATCLDEVCLPGRVAAYAVACGGDIVKGLKYCSTDPCITTGCITYGTGPVARLLPGEAAIRSYPPADGRTCCNGCNDCLTGPYGCCCGKCTDDEGNPIHPCVFTYTSFFRQVIEFDAAAGGGIEITEQWETWSGFLGCYALDGSDWPTLTGRTRYTLNGSVLQDDAISFAAPPVTCSSNIFTENLASTNLRGYLESIGQNPERGFTGCGGGSDSITFTEVSPGFSTRTVTASVSTTRACSIPTICGGGCSEESAGIPAGVGFAGLLPV